MAATERGRASSRSASGDARPGSSCRPKRAGTRTRPTGGSSWPGTVFGVRDGARLVATAALLPYSAGQAWISMVLVTAELSPPRHCDAAGRCLPRCRRKAGSDHLARRDPRWRHRLRTARLQTDAAITPAAARRAARRRGAKSPRLQTSTMLVTRDAAAMGFDRSTLLTEFRARPGSRHRCPMARPSPLSAMDAPRAISAPCSRAAPTGRWR